MKQIIYLGGKKAREYDGVDEPDWHYYIFGMDDPNYEKDMRKYKAHILTLPVVDVIGDCDWKEGEVKTKDVDYKVKRKSRHEFEDSAPVSVIVPIPKKQEGEEKTFTEQDMRNAFRAGREWVDHIHNWQWDDYDNWKHEYHNPQILKK